MSPRILSRALLLLVLLLVQVLLCNHIHLLGYATPFVLIYPILIASSDESRALLLTEAFGLGLVMDVSTNTPGMASAALTLVAFVVPFLLPLLSNPERPDDAFVPSAREMGWGIFLAYAFVLSLIFCAAYYLIAWFTFSHMPGLLMDIVGSTLLSTGLLAALETIHGKLIHD